MIARGRAPSTDREIALGRETARTIHKDIGDDVTVVSNDDYTLRAHVVGIVVVNDPITSLVGAGGGVLVTPGVFRKIAGPDSVAQSIVITLDAHRDRAAAIESVRRDFSGSIREAVPQTDAQNIGHLRTVPWLIAGLIGILAFATLIHALVTILGRNRTTLAVLAAMGFTRRQRNGVGLFASISLVLIGIALGIPLGLIASARVWQTVANGIDLPTQTATAWLTLAVTSAGALGIAALIALTATNSSARSTAAEELRVE